MSLSRSRLGIVYFGVGWPKHASIPGSVGLSMVGRLTRACVYFGVGWPKHASIPGWPEHASIPEPVDPSMSH